ncbi:MAG: glycosyltransferase [Gemmatimonas sp.]
MLYLAIPAHNEAATIGVLLWRLRTVLAEFPREYEAVVYDDASNDSTSEILESYQRVMPLTVLRGEKQLGYAGAVDALVRHVVRDTRYPRRDAMLMLQGDFTDSPQLLPEFVKRFEGGTDIVVGERGRTVRRKAPQPVKRLLQIEPWLTRFLVRAEGVRDLTSSYRLVRLSVLRDLLRNVGDAPVCAGDPRTANADFLMRTVPLARRVETVPVEPTWEVRLRETRVVAMQDGMSLLKWAWGSRGKRAVPSIAPESTGDLPRQARGRESKADLRLEGGRLDASSDAAAQETGRSGREGTRNRRGRGKGEGRTEGRVERSNERSPERAADRTATREGRDAGTGESRRERNGRNSTRQDARAEERNDSRSDTRRERQRKRSRGDNREAKAVAATESEGLLAAESLASYETADVTLTDGADSMMEADGAETRERPARRRRSRNRRDRSTVSEATSETLSPADSEAAGGHEPAAAGQPDDAKRAESPEFESTTHVAELELSATLNDAIADAEMDLDAGDRVRPARRKRRRRGSRGGRNSRGGVNDELSGDEPATGEGSAFEAGADDDPTERDADHDDDSNGADTGDFAAAQSDENGEARRRRRGRRGRRGGSRRNRNRGEGDAGGDAGAENANGGGDFSPPPSGSSDD